MKSNNPVQSVALTVLPLMDHLVGRIIRALEDFGLRDDTVVMFTGDNGNGGEGNGTGYRDVTDSTDPEVLAIKQEFQAILASNPVPIIARSRQRKQR